MNSRLSFRKIIVLFLRTYLLLITILSTTSHANFLPDFGGPASSDKIDLGASFIPPNELNPQEAKGILVEAQKGVYISVGTERGLFGFSLAIDSTHLLQIDRDATVVFYNRMNRALLALAPSLEIYKKLRHTKLHLDWLQELRNIQIPEHDFESLSSEENFFKWQTLIEMNKHEFSVLDHIDASANYHRNPTLFEKLHNVAQAGRIEVVQVDLKHQQQRFEKIAERLKSIGLQVSVFDLSNAWYHNYIGVNKTFEIIAKFFRVTIPESIFLFVGEDGRLGWSYLGVTKAFIEAQRPTFWNFLRYLSPEDTLATKIPVLMANRLNPSLTPIVKLEKSAFEHEMPPYLVEAFKTANQTMATASKQNGSDMNAATPKAPLTQSLTNRVKSIIQLCRRFLIK